MFTYFATIKIEGFWNEFLLKFLIQSALLLEEIKEFGLNKPYSWKRKESGTWSEPYSLKGYKNLELGVFW